MTIPENAPAGDHHRMQQQMHCLSERLKEIGDSGDCAYEKALARAYRALLAQHQAQWPAVETGGPALS